LRKRNVYKIIFKKKFLHTTARVHVRTYARTHAHTYRRTQGDYSSAKILNVLLQVRNTISISWQKKKWIHSACLMIMILLCIMQKIPFRKVLIWTQSYLWKPMEKRDPEIGQRIRLSEGDIAQTNLLYKCHSKNLFLCTFLLEFLNSNYRN